MWLQNRGRKGKACLGVVGVFESWRACSFKLGMDVTPTITPNWRVGHYRHFQRVCQACLLREFCGHQYVEFKNFSPLPSGQSQHRGDIRRMVVGTCVVQPGREYSQKAKEPIIKKCQPSTINNACIHQQIAQTSVCKVLPLEEPQILVYTHKKVTVCKSKVQM